MKAFRRQRQEMPKHIAISIVKHKLPESKKTPAELFKARLEPIKEIILAQTRFNVPIISIYLLDSHKKVHESFYEVIPKVFEELSKNNLIHKNKVKISVLGKWYDLPGNVVESIKKTIESTKDYDNFFLNFCILYDGQEEIVDACKIIGKKIQAQNFNPDAITKEIIKENTYSSYFIPPELMIVFDGLKNINGFLLWDSTATKVYFSDKSFADFSTNDLLKASAMHHRWKAED